MDYYESKFRASGSALRVCWYCFVAIVITLLLGSLTGCKTITKTEIIEKVHTDTTYIVKHQKDSVWLHDSIHVKEKGDSVIIEKWHTQWRDRIIIDTLYQSKIDSIPKPYPVIKEVERELSWWQKTQMYAGDLMFLLLIGFGVWKFIRLKTSLRPS